MATNPLPVVWNESYIGYICPGMLTVWPVEKKKSKPIPKTEHWNHWTWILYTSTTPHTQVTNAISFEENCSSKKTERGRVFSVMFSKIMWACVGKYRLEFFKFFFHKAKGLCSRRKGGVKNEEMSQKWHSFNEFHSHLTYILQNKDF